MSSERDVDAAWTVECGRMASSVDPNIKVAEWKEKYLLAMGSHGFTREFLESK